MHVTKDGTGQQSVARNAMADPAWSPGGRRIAFVRAAGFKFPDVYVANADGSGQQNLTRSAANEGWLAWSPRQST